jgi:hypothetical protein
MNIIDALDDVNVFGGHFRGPTWDAWRVFLAALFALPMTEEQLALYRKHTGRSALPAVPSHEAWLVIGRRGGKSFALATVAVFLACFKDWRSYLGPGEVATIMIVARDRRQARVIKRFVSGLLRAVPMLAATIEDEQVESITLKNRVHIEIHTASFRSTRGYTIVAALLDEIAYWPTDEGSAEPDIEVINAIRPGMATVPDAMLLCASSPHARRGALWEAHRKHHCKDGDPVLCWQAATRDMNPSVPQSYIDGHMADDPARAAAEYLAQFRTDLEAFVMREAVEACVSRGVFERGPLRGVAYAGFVDPSGGSADSMTLCIGHMEFTKQTAVIDAIREVRPPFSPEAVVSEFAALLKTYGIATVSGDRYAGEWPGEQFGKFNIRYEPAPKPKSELYGDLLPLLNSRRIELIDHPKLVNQLLGLERRTARGGKDSIDHAPGQHDDVANAVAGVAHLCTIKGTYDVCAIADAFWGRTPRDPDGAESWRRARFQLYVNSGGQIRL